MRKNVTIAASILTADFINLQAVLDKIVAAKIKVIHFDVMDNHFVPNISFGPKILSDVCSYLKDKEVKVDCHLMIKPKKNEKIKNLLLPYAIEGVNNIALHYEALSKKQIKEFLNWEDAPVKKGLAVSPDTDVKVLLPYLKDLNLVLIMSVQPGFGNQTFIADTYKKIKKLRIFIDKNNLNYDFKIAVDGGINNKTAKMCLLEGANYLVSGSYLINNNIENQLKKLLNE